MISAIIILIILGLMDLMLFVACFELVEEMMQDIMRDLREEMKGANDERRTD